MSDHTSINLFKHSPASVKDKEVIEEVQQRPTKWIQGLKNKRYADD